MDLPFDKTRRRRLHLMRHADAAYFAPDGTRAQDPRSVPLSPLGEAEAGAMAALLADLSFDRAVCSGLPRTRRTAEIVLGPRALPLEIVPELEEIHGGPPEARERLRPVDYAYGLFQADAPDARFAGGESFAAFRARVLPAFARLLADPGWSNLLLVAHGGVNRVILTSLLDLGLGHLGLFEQDSCCLNVIDIDVDRDTHAPIRRMLRAVNVTAADPAKARTRLSTMERLTQRAFPAPPR